MKEPSLKKLRRLGLVPIRWHSEDGYYHGWIIEELPNGNVKVQLISEERPRTLRGEQLRYLERLPYDKPSVAVPPQVG